MSTTNESMTIITGASDGLGLELARLSQARGERVINLSRTPSAFADDNLSCDLSDPGQIGLAAEEVLAMPERIRLLANCAGVMSLQPPDALTSEEVQRVFAVNVMAPMLLTSLLSGRLVTDRSEIVNVSSTSALNPTPSQPAYGATKAGLSHYSKSLQAAMGRTNRITDYVAGAFRSGIMDKAGEPRANDGTLIDAADIARHILSITDLPRTMENSQTVVRRRPPQA